MYKLTKQDLKALKNSDTLSFHYSIDGFNHVFTEKDILSMMHLTLDASHSSTAYEQGYFIPCDAIFDNFSKGLLKANYAFSWKPYYKSDVSTMTWINLLKENDSIRLLWIVCNNSQSMNEKGINTHELRLQVYRNDSIKYEFHIDQETGEQNSASMVRQYHR